MRRRWVLRGFLTVLAVVLAMSLAWRLTVTQALVYRLTGSQRAFNVVVSRRVAAHDTLIQLESVVGPARRPASDDKFAAYLIKRAEQRGPLDPDGWRPGDFWVAYDFPARSSWYFQVRDGRLVNYQPSALADQPQDSLTALLSK